MGHEETQEITLFCAAAPGMFPECLSFPAFDCARILVDPAVVPAVEDIDYKADSKPEYKAQVGHQREREDQEPAGEDAEDWDKGDKRAPERAGAAMVACNGARSRPAKR